MVLKILPTYLYISTTHSENTYISCLLLTRLKSINRGLVMLIFDLFTFLIATRVACDIALYIFIFISILISIFIFFSPSPSPPPSSHTHLIVACFNIHLLSTEIWEMDSYCISANITLNGETLWARNS